MRPPLKLFVLKSFVRKAEQCSKIRALPTPDCTGKHSPPILCLKLEGNNLLGQCLCLFLMTVERHDKMFFCVLCLWPPGLELRAGKLGTISFHVIQKATTSHFQFIISASLWTCNLRSKDDLFAFILSHFARTKCEYHSSEMFSNCYVSPISWKH